jgi:hypothetical protein
MPLHQNVNAPDRGLTGAFHNRYIISTAQYVLEPAISGELWTSIHFNGRAIFQQKRGAHDLQETRQRESGIVSGKLLQRVVLEE